jgi:AAA domain
MIRIVKATEPLTVDRINVCIYSPPGLGKTTLAFTAADPLLLDCDKGSYRAANRKDTVPVGSWADIANVTPSDLAAYKTVIVDTAGRALDFLTADIIAANPKMGRGGALTLQGYGELKSKFSAWLKMLRTCGKDVLLLAHMDEQRNGDDVIERLDVQGGSKAEIYKSVDAMGRLFIRNNERFLDFNPRDNSFGKNPCGLPVMPFSLEDKGFMAGVIATIKERLNASVEVEKVERNLMQDWDITLKECKDVTAMNDMLPSIRKAGPRVIALANKRARELNLVYDKPTGTWASVQKEEKVGA